MMKKSTPAIALALSLALVGAACSDDASETTADEATETTVEAVAEEETAEEEAAEEETAEEETAEEETAVDEVEPGDEVGTIVDVAGEAGSFTTLLAAAEAADLVDTLSGDGPLTVFAPTDEAFAAALDDLGLTAEELLASEDLADILTYHVLADNVMAADVVGLDGQSVATVNGAELTITVEGDTVMVNDATVTATDIAAANGTIHVIDSVLLP
jgi:uncharacterized surface protein with fasciclin (FAS1) repeats